MSDPLDLKRFIRTVENFPIDGISFRDITSLIETPEAFVKTCDELTKITKTRFIIITHHALTMSRMHRLYGVTMAEQGISQLVSVDLQKAEELVA